MSIFIAFLLGGALLVVSFRLYRHRGSTLRLLEAVRRKQPFLREDLPGDMGPYWDDLCVATNEVISEVTHLQQQRSGQLAQLEATLGSLQEAVLIVDANNYIMLANQALQAMFPRASQVMGSRLELVLQSAQFLGYVDTVRRGDAKPQHEIEFVDGPKVLWLEVTGTVIPPLSGQKGPWVLFVLHDITRQKKLEVVRKDFVANVSHELRTPLSVIKGYVETLVDNHRDIPLEDRERFLRTIQRHTERLNSLLEDLLVLSRLESINPGLRRESTSLDSLINAIIEDYRARPSAAEHTLQVEVDPAIDKLLIDPLKITQVFENLIDNALKYSAKGSCIAISAKLHATEAEVCVRDNGAGIPEADLPHIFERFYRVDKGRSRDKGGTGLGLSIVKHIVQLHGGRVRVESTLGQGTAFFFTLPVKDVLSAPKVRSA
jgi:two-component system phosphate regulon sensor histidine kinase PhoR